MIGRPAAFTGQTGSLFFSMFLHFRHICRSTELPKFHEKLHWTLVHRCFKHRHIRATTLRTKTAYPSIAVRSTHHWSTECSSCATIHTSREEYCVDSMLYRIRMWAIYQRRMLRLRTAMGQWNMQSKCSEANNDELKLEMNGGRWQRLQWRTRIHAHIAQMIEPRHNRHMDKDK